MNSFIRQYESETGEKAIYRMGCSDFHTLRYVNWLENWQKNVLEEITHLKAQLSDSQAEYCHMKLHPDCPTVPLSVVEGVLEEEFKNAVCGQGTVKIIIQKIKQKAGV